MFWNKWRDRSLGEIVAGRVGRWKALFDKPAPWSEEEDAAARASDAVPVCHHCATPCGEPVWFCPSCGAAVGPYNNLMPYLRIFSRGEALRSGVGPGAHFTPFRVVAYLAMGFAGYAVFAPLYSVRLYMNWRRLEKQAKQDTKQAT